MKNYNVMEMETEDLKTSFENLVRDLVLIRSSVLDRIRNDQIHDLTFNHSIFKDIAYTFCIRLRDVVEKYPEDFKNILSKEDIDFICDIGVKND